ncbi:MAG TPA: ribosome silencing factor [Deltaproteobacteria bacterium]|nr:ribosome silencing factor [Deltaproteobacteria bacterium]
MDTLQLALDIALETQESKAKDIKILDLRNLVAYADYFIICSGTSDRHVQSIADRVHLKLKKDRQKLPLSFEGRTSGQWVLLDYGDVVLHVFLDPQRRYYGLEEFWAQAPEVSSAAPASKPRKKAAGTRKISGPSPAKKTQKKPARRSAASRKKK